MTAATPTKEKTTRAPLEPRVIFMIVAGLCLVSLVLWFMLHFKARQQQLQDINDQLDSSTTQLTDLQSKQSQIPQLQKDVDTLKKNQQVFLKALPPTSEMGQYLDGLRTIVGSSGAVLDSMNVNTNGNPVGLPVGVKAQDLAVNVSGDFSSVYKSLQGIETAGRFTKVHSVNISSDTTLLPNGVVSAEPKLRAVINMTIYTLDPVAASAAPAAGTAPAAAPAATGGKS